MRYVVAAVAAVVGAPIGWIAWRWAQSFIEARSLEKGDTEILLPWWNAVALNVVVFGSLGYRFGDGPIAVLLAYLVVFAFLTVLLLVDFGRYYLPNRLIAIALGVGAAAFTGVALLESQPGRLSYLAGGVALTFAVYFVFWFIAMLAFGGRALGFGDVKLASVLGLLLGWLAFSFRDLWALIFYSVMIGFLSGALISLALLRGASLKSAFPQGPFLVLGTLAVVLFSAQVLR